MERARKGGGSIMGRGAEGVLQASCSGDSGSMTMRRYRLLPRSHHSQAVFEVLRLDTHAKKKKEGDAAFSPVRCRFFFSFLNRPL